jgi:hypothetical protein
MGTFILKKKEDFWKNELEKLKNNRKNIIGREFSQTEGILNINYKFSDGSNVKIPLQILESFIINGKEDE